MIHLKSLLKLKFKIGAELNAGASDHALIAMISERAYFGRNTFGLDQALEIYFDGSVDTMTVSQAAFLAGVLKSPNRYAQAPYATERRNRILQTMEWNGAITTEQHGKARAAPLIFVDLP